MRANYCVVMLLAILSSLITARSVPAGDRNATLEFKEHQLRIQNFRCSPPQSRSYRISELISAGIRSHEVILPTYTVIQRCDAGTGCCIKDNETCGPVANTTRWEKVQVKIQYAAGSRGPPVFGTLSIEHHTQCECQSTTNNLLSGLPKATLSNN